MVDVAAMFASAKAETSRGAAELSLVGAARRADTARVSAIVSDNPKLNLNAKCSFSGLTALHWSAEKGAVGCARALIKGGAKVDARDSNQWTPLMAAAQKGSVEMVNLLLSSGADRTLLAKGRTALDVALGPEVEALLGGTAAGGNGSSANEQGTTSQRATQAGGSNQSKRLRDQLAERSGPSRATRRSRRGS